MLRTPGEVFDDLHDAVVDLLNYFGDPDTYEGATIEAIDSDSGDVVYAELPTELVGLLDALKEMITEVEDEAV